MNGCRWPYMNWFVSDWLGDPKVSQCEPATRGILFDWLCNMHALDRSGSITGTPGLLSRLGRCTVPQCEAALADLQRTNAAEITDRNGVVTVVNRRMKREQSARKHGSKRQATFRDRHRVTPVSPDILVPVPVPKESGTRARDQTEVSGLSPDANIPTIQEVLSYADLHGLPSQSARKFFNHHENNRLWLNQYDRLINWQSKLVSWAAADRQLEPSQPKRIGPRAASVSKLCREKWGDDPRSGNWAASFYSHWEKREWSREGKPIDWEYELSKQVARWKTEAVTA